MTDSLSWRYKLSLMKGAWRRGANSFVYQSWLIALDRFVRKRELFYRIEARDIPDLSSFRPSGVDEIDFREIERWEELPENFRRRVLNAGDHFKWYGRDWFGSPRRLWVGLQGGRVVALGWWCPGEEASKHFFPVPERCDYLLNALVLPEERGRRLHIALRITCMLHRARQGTEAFYIGCRDYNLPSRHNIEKIGFRQVGSKAEWRLLGCKRLRVFPVRQ